MNSSTEKLLCDTLENINRHLEGQSATLAFILQTLRQIERPSVIQFDNGELGIKGNS